MDPSAEASTAVTLLLTLGAQSSSAPVVMSKAMALYRGDSFSPAAAPAGRALLNSPTT